MNEVKQIAEIVSETNKTPEKILNSSKKNGMIFRNGNGKGGAKVKKWQISELDKEKAREIMRKYGIPWFSAMLLAIRGITEQQQIEQFFDKSGELPDPFTIKDMDKAVDRIKTAVTNGQKICVYGDYDCDGVTSTALLYSYLESVFANVMFYIPDRNTEGYGMNKKAVDYLHEQQIDLIVTVDNGISAIDEIYYAGQLGIDVVITDHHTPQDVLPNACAIVNPHRADDTSEFTDCCGAGLALMLAIALEGDSFLVIENYSDLAAFGTIADLVPLSGVNRTIVQSGLIRIENGERLGIARLMEQAQTDKINAGVVGFRLAPRINAAGRLGSPKDALELLLTEQDSRAEYQAENLSELNTKRQTIETKIYESICQMLESDEDLTLDRVLVVSSENWNPGVIGIVASRITEKYGKPCIIISEDDELCKGSGRSVAGFSLVDAIFACSGYLEKYGGHPMAAGISLKREKIKDFRYAINRYADKLESMPLLSVKIDCKLNPEVIVADMVHQLRAFEPFGYGNPKPIFALTKMHLDKIVPLSGGKHLKLLVSRGKAHLSLMKFSTTPEEFPYTEGSDLDFAVSLDINIYQQQEYLSFNIKDIRPSDLDIEQAMLELQIYEQYQKDSIRPQIADFFPTRSEFAEVYRYIRKSSRSIFTIDSVLSSMSSEALGAFKLLMILDIMKEMKLISYTRSGDYLNIKLKTVDGKVNLEESYILGKLKEDIDHVRNRT